MRLPARPDRNLLLCFGLTLGYFGLLIGLLHPQYGTVEDFMILYGLSGGFGAEPTPLLHYNHILNPLLGYPLSLLFRVAGSINWYTVVLLCGHIVACTLIAHALLRRNTKLQALVAYTLFFFVFETYYFSVPNFTNTALVLGIAGLLRLTTDTLVPGRRKGLAAPLLYAGASLFRIHVLLPLLPLAAPFWLLLVPRRQWLRIGVATGAALLLIGALHLLHRTVYEHQISGWTREEVFRQQAYRFYNHQQLRGADSATQQERALIEQRPLLDTQLVSIPQMEARFHADYQPGFRTSRTILYWFLVNNKVYFLALIMTALYLRQRREWLALAASTLVGATLWFVLNYYYAKFPDYLLMAFLSFPMLLAISTRNPGPGRKRVLYLLPGLLAAWGLWIKVKQARQQAAQTAQFEAVYQDFAAHPDILFYADANQVPFFAYPVWKSPARYPLHNVLLSEHFLNHLDGPILRRYGLNHFRDLPLHDLVYLVGWNEKDIRAYFNHFYPSGISLQPVTGSFRAIQPYQVVLRQP